MLLGLLASLWGASYLLIKVAVASIPPITLIAIRVSVATVFLLLVMRLQSVWFPSDWPTWRKFLVQSFFNSFGSWTILAWGQQFVDAGLAGVLNSTSPIFVFFLVLIFSKTEAVDGWKLFGTALGLFGVAAVIGLDSINGLGTAVGGQLAILAGAFLYACAALYGKGFSSIPPTVTAAGTMVWATAILVPASILVDRPWTLAPTSSSLAAALALGLFSTGIALLIYFRLVKTMGAMGVASQSYLRAGISVLLGIVFLGESMTMGIGIGLAAVVMGVAIINLPRPRIPARFSLRRD